MSGIRTPPTSGRDYGRIVLQEFTEQNDVTPTEIPVPDRSTGSVAIRASEVNDGAVYIGFDDDVDLESGFPLYRRDSIGIELNLRSQSIYVVADNNADEVRYIITN